MKGLIVLVGLLVIILSVVIVIKYRKLMFPLLAVVLLVALAVIGVQAWGLTG